MKKTAPLAKRFSLPYTHLIESVNKKELATVPTGRLGGLIRETGERVERYAAVKELIKRLTGLQLFDSQLATAFALQNGKIAELPTGEGKTLAAVVAAVCYALEGHKVHILVFNDYLAKRDYDDNKAIYQACGLTAGYIDQHAEPQQRQAAYGCDVTYVSAKEAGFDYLRDFLCMEPEQLVFPVFDVAIVDEADSIMIDEGKTPLVLAGPLPKEKDNAKRINHCITQLRQGYVEVDKTAHQVWLTDAGINSVEAMLGVRLYNDENMEVLAGVQNALDAHYLLKRDEDYIVKDGAIQIIEATTGRVVLNKRYPDLLHRAVEVKEGLEPKPLTAIYNSMTIQHFLQQYPVLCGMTGTIATSAEEIYEAYGLEIDVIPPHTPCIRTDHPDAIFMDEASYRNEVMRQIKQSHQKRQPVLIGTQSVAESEVFSSLLAGGGIPHVVLNAKNDEQEAALIAKAGEPGCVTISTNMAGRGVDIKLGGNGEEYRDEVVQAGGLYVVGAGINACVRIDNQLRGRAGRQGDPGESRFFVCLEDVGLAGRMTGLQKVRAEVGGNKTQQNTVRRIQRQLDGEAAQARYTLQRYSHITEQHRQQLAAWRNKALNGQQPIHYLKKKNHEKYEQLVVSAGEQGVQKAERQLTLYYINKHWADYLATMEVVRSGIHFNVMGNRNPLEEYTRSAVDIYGQMIEEIEKDVLTGMETLPITKDGINMEEAGLAGGTTTWTYAIDESANQFNQLRHLMQKAREQMTGEQGFLTKWYKKWKKADR